ncbi:unnamed protein product [Dimorphilus gyrociliatus]|uniref:Uncharacterized protein n=1 Tax=Dimorphilus gyrociliatus TaxID=2664684 RepID=A0A7I8W7I7_9ANNE|nr:unnamed protein product [Dimorphilus gyrociliatus]
MPGARVQPIFQVLRQVKKPIRTVALFTQQYFLITGYSHHYKIRRSSRNLIDSDSRPNQSFSSKVTFEDDEKPTNPIKLPPEEKNRKNYERKAAITEGHFIENLDVEFEYEF